MNKLTRMLSTLIMAGLVMSACSRNGPPAPDPVPAPSAAAPAGPEDLPESPSTDAAAPVVSSSAAPVPEFKPPRQASSASEPLDSVRLQESPSVSSGPALPRKGADLLRGQGVTLVNWQWVDNFRILILAQYPPAEAVTSRVVLYDRRNGVITEQYASGATGGAFSFFSDDYALFFVDNKTLAYKKPDGVRINSGEMPDFGAYLPPEDAEFRYYGLQFSSDRKYFLYERSPQGYELEGRPASDRIVIDTERESANNHPLRDIGFTFNVRTAPKTVRWIHGADRILVDVRLPVKDEFGVYDRVCYVFDAGSGKQVEEFRPSGEGLVLCDAYKTRILFEKPGENYELLVYDYKTGKMVTVARLEGQTRGSCAAKFSLNGQEVALVRPDTELEPEIYPVPEN